MTSTNQLETKLKEIFADKAPALPEGGKKFIVTYGPWLTLIGGILTVLSALSLWNWAHVANSLNDYAASICAAYSTTNCGGNIHRLNAWIWLSLVVMLIEGALYVLAFPGLRDRKKQGWNLVFYIALVNVVLGVFSIFNGYGGIGSFIGNFIGSAIGFYFLFQVRSFYLGTTTATTKTPVKPAAPAAKK